MLDCGKMRTEEKGKSRNMNLNLSFSLREKGAYNPFCQLDLYKKLVVKLTNVHFISLAHHRSTLGMRLRSHRKVQAQR